MDITALSARYRVRRLTPDDAPLVYALCRENTLYYQYCPPFVTEEGIIGDMAVQINEIVLQDLAELHSRLLASTKFPFYNAEYYKVLPFIVELRNKGNKDQNEITTCLESLYGTMLLRLQKKEISPDTLHAIKEITTFIGMLSDYYIKDKTEGLVFEDD
ncbi:MAG: DUF4924 family protein [Prevotella sp.]|nr:DUF4924 family protein [Prevotella sp.]